MKVLFFYNPNKVSLEHIKEHVIPLFKKYKIEILNIFTAGTEVTEKVALMADYYVVFGGDGTVLRVSELSADYSKPIIGINMGNLGFLTAYSETEIELAAKEISKESITFSERMMLECIIANKKFLALNDIVIQKSQPLRTINLDVLSSNNILYSFKGDGIIVSTPTGSTAYGLSAGGAIIDPNLNAIEIIPLSPHALNIRPFILSPEKKIVIKIKSDEMELAYVTADGDIIHRLELNTSLTITSSKKKVKLAQKLGDNFCNVLNYKLAFGRRFE
ncbi:NAD kinase [Tepiditoga spiralis]|uniref:NAD kinase n=1 Tax=Tepiditoga spiralis TaxID=2108365 RepID=A0A7G1G4S0_9BACT|nr:NAD(+)/NADH kinase [Tepiditoga spiralis]BBE31105.1 NAD kinase [Tepiditoga spiralis]